MENQVPENHWKPISSDALCSKIITIVKDVATRLSDPGQVRDIEDSANGFTNGNVLGLAGGYAGISLLFCELAQHFPGESWENVAGQYHSKIEESVATPGFDDLSLFCGAAGIGTAARIFLRSGGRADGTDMKLAALVQECLMKALPKEITFCRSKLGDVEAQDYDVVYGLSGIGRYLLSLKDEPACKSLLEDVLFYLVSLTADIDVDGQTVPGWYISADNRLNKGEEDVYPSGYFDCGLSHGIAGPLALLAISSLSGIEVKGQREAIRKIARWLDEWKDESGYWACLVGLEEYAAGDRTGLASRDAWCYGAPGVARVLWLAGTALNDPYLQKSAVDAFDAVFTRTVDSWKVISPTFCHGFAGLLHLANLMYQDTGLARFDNYRGQILTCLLNYYKPDSYFGFYDYSPGHDGITPMSKAGLLDGSAGIALTMLSLVKPLNTGWDAVFLVT